MISIHAPRAGGDLTVWVIRFGLSISIHAPRAGGDSISPNMTSAPSTFQSTPPVRGATGGFLSVV